MTKNINILHLSDLHFGEGEREDVDWKVYIEGATREKRRERLAEFITHLPSVPDYVVVSGDLTIQGREGGFQLFRSTITDLISQKYLPPIRNVLVVPGNHDVLRNADPTTRLAPFAAAAMSCTRPWIEHIDPPLAAMKELVLKGCKQDKAVWGGSSATRIELSGDIKHTCLPFLVDRDSKIFFYTFNSATISGTLTDIPVSVKEAMSWLKDWRSPESDKIRRVLEAFETSRSVDPARIDPQEFSLFTTVINQLRDQLGESELDAYTKVAILHHHVAPMLVEEFKSFEMLLNAGRFKYELQKAGFHLVLHGHKHAPVVFLDAATLHGGSHYVVSGGTIGGGESPGSLPGFYVHEISDGEFLSSRYIPIMPGNPRDIYKEAFVTAVRLIKSKSESAPVVPRHPPTFNLSLMKDEVARELFRHLRRRTSPSREVVGWSHHLDEDDVTSIATAYGVRLMFLAGVRDPSFRYQLPLLQSTLLALRHTDGCWSASGQSSRGRPESTCWVLMALWEFGDGGHIQQVVSALEEMVSENNDIVFWNTISSMAHALSTLADVWPTSRLVPELAAHLLRGGARDSAGKVIHWGRHPYGNASEATGAPSVVHTAQTAIALTKAFEATSGACGLDASELVNVRTFLCKTDDYNNTTEDIVRRDGDTVNRLVVKHYTNTWIVRALLRLGVSPYDERVCQAIQQIIKDYDRGLWKWSGVPKAIWATHDGLMALQTWQTLACTPGK